MKEVCDSGGEFTMGDEAFADAKPLHKVSVEGFWMDETEVTNEQFAEFVRQTDYVTIAERTPRVEDFPPWRGRSRVNPCSRRRPSSIPPSVLPVRCA